MTHTKDTTAIGSPLKSDEPAQNADLDPEYLKGLAAAESVRLDRGLRGPERKDVYMLQ